jgi:hypothetical protein
MTQTYHSAKHRYVQHRLQARHILEDDLLPQLRFRVDATAITADTMRVVERDWYGSPERRVDWEWWREIIGPLHRTGARYFDLALWSGGVLCALAAARVSPNKRWLSLTWVEGAPGDHPLKGVVLPVVVAALYVYRGVICTIEEAPFMGIRVLRVTDEALGCYRSHGYTDFEPSKKMRAIVIQQPIARLYNRAEHGREAESGSGTEPATTDGATGSSCA